MRADRIGRRGRCPAPDRAPRFATPGRGSRSTVRPDPLPSLPAARRRGHAREEAVRAHMRPQERIHPEPLGGIAGAGLVQERRPLARRSLQGQVEAFFVNHRRPPGSDTGALMDLKASRILHEHVSHRLGRRGDEVPTAPPVLRAIRAREPQGGLVHQRPGLERVARPLAFQPPCGQQAQLVIHQREQLLRDSRVAALDGREQTCHVIQRGWAAGGRS